MNEKWLRAKIAARVIHTKLVNEELDKTKIARYENIMNRESALREENVWIKKRKDKGRKYKTLIKLGRVNQ